MKKNLYTSRSGLQKNFFLTLLIVISSSLTAKSATRMNDISFGNKGEAVTQFTNRDDRAQAIVIQPDGKIVAGGFSQQQTSLMTGYDFALARYYPDGTLDNSFGSGGRVVTTFEFINGNLNNYASRQIYGLALQPDGKIIASGDNLIIKYNADGTIDTSFGINGRVPIMANGISVGIRALILQPDNKILVAGYAGNQNEHTIILRYNNDGILDTTFGINGSTISNFGKYDNAFAVALQPDSKIVVGGSRGNDEDIRSSFIARYTTDGILDNSFSDDGFVTIRNENRNDATTSLAIQPDGKILGAGISSFSSGGIYSYYPTLSRFNNDGSPDQNFGTNGKILEKDYYNSTIQAVKLQSDGKIIAAGFSNNTAELFRYNPNGTLDESFGVAGKMRHKVFDGSYATALALQADGQIVTAGYKYLGYVSNSVINNDFMVARYLSGQGKSIAKFDFDGDGKSDIGLFRPSEGVWYLNQSAAGVAGAQFGAPGDKPVAADYDGDGVTDLAVFRNGVWYLMRSQTGFTAIQFGDVGDIPLPMDFDEDDKSELVVYRPSNSYFYYLNLKNNEFIANKLGQSGDIPAVIKYNHIKSAGLVVFRNGTWNVLVRNPPYVPYTWTFEFGTAGDAPVPADYDGDGTTDLAVFRPSNATWYFQYSTGGYSQITFGTESDTPVPADYDGDGKTDVAVFRNGVWYINRSSKGQIGVAFGRTSDKPVSTSYLN